MIARALARSPFDVLPEPRLISIDHALQFTAYRQTCRDLDDAEEALGQALWLVMLAHEVGDPKEIKRLQQKAAEREADVDRLESAKAYRVETLRKYGIEVLP